jgi:hypothetical protein
MMKLKSIMAASACAAFGFASAQERPEQALVRQYTPLIVQASGLLLAPLPDPKDAKGCAHNFFTLLAAANAVRAPVLHDMLVREKVGAYGHVDRIAGPQWHKLANDMKPVAQKRLDAMHESGCMRAVNAMSDAETKALNEQTGKLLDPIRDLQLKAVVNLTENLSVTSRDLSGETCKFADAYGDWLVRQNSYSGGVPIAGKTEPYLMFRETVRAVCKAQLALK